MRTPIPPSRAHPYIPPLEPSGLGCRGFVLGLVRPEWNIFMLDSRRLNAREGRDRACMCPGAQFLQSDSSTSGVVLPGSCLALVHIDCEILIVPLVSPYLGARLRIPLYGMGAIQGMGMLLFALESGLK